MTARKTGRIFGYCRISTPKQKMQRQIDNIREKYPTAEIIREVYTGATTARPAWEKLEKKLTAGDVVIFDEVSRMSRSAAEGVATYEKLYKAGVELVFLKEPHINTDVYRRAQERHIDLGDVSTGRSAIDKSIVGLQDWINQLLMNLAREQIELAFGTAQRELELLRKRTSEGVRRAQANGKRVGRTSGREIDTSKAKKCRAQIRRLSRDFEGGLTDPEVIKLLGIARNSFYKYKKQVAAGL